MQQVIIAQALIKQDQKVLLLRRNDSTSENSGLFELPGGKVNVGEDPKAALRSEVQEQTGATITTLQPLEVCSFQHDAKQYIILVFLAALHQPVSLKMSREHDKYTWKMMQNILHDEITLLTRTALQIHPAIAKTDESMVNNRSYDVLNTTHNEQVIVYADGGSRGNPGPSAAGFVIKSPDDKLLFEGGKYLGITTNNQAEYQAVKLALDKAIEIGATAIQCRLDSQLVVNQLNGVYQIRNRELWPIHAYIKELVQYKIKKITFVHVRREFNKEADAMVNKVLDEQKSP